MRKIRFYNVGFLLFLICIGLAAASSAQTTSFTYQGKLNDSSMAATGSYDFQFALFADAAGGTQVGTTITVPNVTVTNGIFTLQLDFGNTTSSFAAGADRYLEISVKRTVDTAYTRLTPRQQVLSSPYSVRAISSGSADTAANATQLGGVAAASYVQTTDPRMADARPPTAGSADYIQNTTAQQAANFNVSGTGSAGIMNAEVQYNIGGQRVLMSDTSENTFVGVSSGAANTSGFGNAFFGDEAGFKKTTSSLNSFFGSSSGFSITTGNLNTFIGALAGSNITTGGNNTFVGAEAGNGNSGTGEESNDTLLGSGANISSGVSFSTAIGFGALATTSNTIFLGTSAENTVVSGQLKIANLGVAGGTSLCLNASNLVASCSSSFRYKKNILPFGEGLNLVNKLHPISFTWKDGGMRDLGLGAEDVEKVEPRLVTYNKKGEVEGVKYDRVVVILLNAVKEQQAQIERQGEQLRRQQRMIDALERTVHRRRYSGGKRR